MERIYEFHMNIRISGNYLPEIY